MRFTLVLSLLIAVLAVVFALQNPAIIDVNLGPFEITGSTALVLMVTFCVGVLVGILATIPTIVKRKKRIRSLEHSAAEGSLQSTAHGSSGPSTKESKTFDRP